MLFVDLNNNDLDAFNLALDYLDDVVLNDLNKDGPDDLVHVVNLELDDLDDVVDGQVQEHLVPVLVLLHRQGGESTTSFSGERQICSSQGHFENHIQDRKDDKDCYHETKWESYAELQSKLKQTTFVERISRKYFNTETIAKTSNQIYKADQ